MNHIRSGLVPLLVSAALMLGSGNSVAAVIAHWNFEEGTIGNTASVAGSVLDVSGNGHHGTPIGGPTYAALGGGTALDFDGTNDRVFVDNSAAFRVPSLTVEAIIELDSLNTSPSGLDQIVFLGDSRAGLDPFYLGILEGRLTFLLQGVTSSSVRVLAPDLLPLGEVLHVAGTINDADGAMRLYINGSEVASTTTTHRPHTLALSVSHSPGIGIGNLQDGGNQFLDGRIGDARLSDVALTPDQFLGASTAVPEPVSLALMAAGGIALLGARRRRRGCTALEGFERPCRR